MDSYLTVDSQALAEFTQKKSRFVACVRPEFDVARATDFLARVRASHHQARRHCYAYIVLNKDEEIARFSDDGEPFGTAGLPLLNIIRNAGLANVMIVVTRYFGGVLLGAGGLVRAYSTAGAKAVANATKVQMQLHTKASIAAPYSCLSKIKHAIARYQAVVVSENYSNDVEMIVFVRRKDAHDFQTLIAETTFGVAAVQIDEQVSEFFKCSSKKL